MHSNDYLIRTRHQALSGIEFQHLHTEQDATVLEDACDLPHSVIAGTTEWVGNIQGTMASIGWDWVQLHDGAVHALKQVAPRTNLQVIDPKGYDLSMKDTVAVLWSVIEALPWESEVASTTHCNT
jgi:Domain of unknown function (DUF4902)